MQLLAIDPMMWFGSADDWTAEEAAGRVSKALDAPDALVPWLNYARVRTGVQHPCARPLLEALENGVIAPEDAEQAWQIAWLGAAARKLYASEPVLLRFAGFQLNDIRGEYARLDSIAA